MAKHSKPERADVKVAQKLSPARESPIVRALGTFSELADQPQLNTICVATLGIGLISGNRRMAKAGFRMLATQLLSTRLKVLIKHRVDRTRPNAVANGRNYERHTGNNHASEMNSFRPDIPPERLPCPGRSHANIQSIRSRPAPAPRRSA